MELAKPAWAACRVEGSSTSASWIERLLVGEVAERRRLEEVTKRSIWVSRRPSSLVSRPKSWITRGERPAALGDAARLRSAM